MRVKTPPPSESEDDYDEAHDFAQDPSVLRMMAEFKIQFNQYEQNQNQNEKTVTYLNHSGKTPLPLSVQRAGQTALFQESYPWKLQDDAETTDQVRQRFASLINAPSSSSSSCNDIAIVPSTGFAMTLAAHNLFRMIMSKNVTNANKRANQNEGASVRDPSGKIKVLILQDEMSSEIYCWQEPFKATSTSACTTESMVEFIIVPHPQGFQDELESKFMYDKNSKGWTELIIDTLQNHNDVDICCIPQVHWSDGSSIDLEVIGKYCHEHSIPLVVDATQTVGILNVNVQSMHCDVLAAATHKWLLGPIGMCLMYIHPKYHDTWLPLDQHERARVAFQTENYDAMENKIRPGSGSGSEAGYPAAFIPGAARCDGGGKKNPILLPMVNEGLRLVCDHIDISSAQEYLRCITNEIYHRARDLGFGIQAGPRCGHIIGLRPQDPALMKLLTPEKMVEVAHKLKSSKWNVVIAVRCGALRISPYVTTTMDDVTRLIQALREECSYSQFR